MSDGQPLQRTEADALTRRDLSPDTFVYTGKLYIGRTRSRPARTRRSATHSLGKPTRGQDATSSEQWVLVGAVPALITEEEFERVQANLP